MKKFLAILTLGLAIAPNIYSQDDRAYRGQDDVYQNDNSSYTYNEERPSDSYYDNDPSDYETFYDQLAPYGQWVNYDGYGAVWVPSASEGFSPYLSDGHWAYSDMGWTWVSDYSWGWAPFHYGRWFEDSYYGWVWVPGHEWAPAWVTWGSYADNYCWAPIAPGYGYNNYRPEAHRWNFIPREHIAQCNVRNYVVNHERHERNINVNVMHNEEHYNNSHFNSGPRIADVEREAGHNINRMNVTSASRPGTTHVSENRIEIYRPSMEHRSAPRNDTKPAIDRNENRAFSQPAPRSFERPAQQNYSDPAHRNMNENNGFQRATAQSQPAQRSFERPVQQNYSEPARRNMNENSGFQRATAQSQPAQRSYERPVQQNYSEPARRNMNENSGFQRATAQSQPAQRSYERPAQQNFSQSSNNTRSFGRR